MGHPRRARRRVWLPIIGAHPLAAPHPGFGDLLVNTVLGTVAGALAGITSGG